MKSKGTCKVCGTEAYAKGYCNKHYNQIRIHGRLRPDLERGSYSSEERECSVDGCYGVVVAKGLCMTHYQQQRRANSNADQIESELSGMPSPINLAPTPIIDVSPTPPVVRRVVRRRA